MMSVAAMLFMLAPPPRRHLALNAPDEHALPAERAQGMSDLDSPRQQRKLGDFVPNPVV
jgi:hypothetical protein